MPDQPKPSASIEFPISELDREIADLIPQMPPPPRWPAFNAIRHLNRAWKLRESDIEMMVLRCITAEEEAATAVFRSLQRRRYDGASQLNAHNHVHKNALWPFVLAVGRQIAEGADYLPETQLFFDKSKSPPALFVRFKAGELADGRTVWGRGTTPFGLSLTRSSPTEDDVPVDFVEHIAEIASEANAKSVKLYLRERANLRNLLLYAASEGYYQISGKVEDVFYHYQRTVSTLLRIYVMIDPYAKKQEFVQHCLSAFLKMLTRTPKQEIFE